MSTVHHLGLTNTRTQKSLKTLQPSEDVREAGAHMFQAAENSSRLYVGSGSVFSSQEEIALSYQKCKKP